MGLFILLILLEIILSHQHVTLRAVDCVAECCKAARMHTSTKLIVIPYLVLFCFFLQYATYFMNLSLIDKVLSLVWGMGMN